MSDRSNEVTESGGGNGHAPATDDLLEETEQLLSESDANAGAGAGETPADARSPETGSSSVPTDEGAVLDSTSEPTREEASSADTGSSRLPSFPSFPSLSSRLSPTQYFSPKAFLALVLVLGAGLLAGDTVLPIAGRLLGMFATAFTIGAIASKRRYLELTVAGLSVGAIAGVLNRTFFVVAGAGQRVAVVGATIGLVACLGGYYFGRDLRNGLRRDVD